MIVRYLVKVFLLSILVNKSVSECLCTQRNQEVTCNQYVIQNQGTSVGIDSYLSTKSALPFQDIQALRLHCNIKTVSAKWFTTQTSITELDLSTNAISRIRNDFFNNMPHLLSLNMSHNELRNPYGNVFKNIGNLKILDLSFNKISNINIEILDSVPLLERLYVSNNGLFELLTHTFEDTIKIKEIDLSYNHIRSIDKLLFKYNPDLESVNFAENDVYGNLEMQTFSYSKKLKYLNLSNAHINLIPDFFVNNEGLQILDLSKNELQNFPSGIFNPLVNLEMLSLASCQFLNVESNLLHQNKKLTYLDLSGNNLRQFPAQLFDMAQNLLTLNVSKNLFRSISGSIFQKTKLVTLDLSSNLLNDVTADLFNVATLENVYLQNNKIVHFNSLSHSPFPLTIKYLNIEFNQVVFLKPELFKVLTNLKEIEILNNPWNCKCFDQLLEILTKNNVMYKVGDFRKGTVPLCVVSDICNYNETNLNYYYDIYKKGL